jgi:hypothetical protein
MSDRIEKQRIASSSLIAGNASDCQAHSSMLKGIAQNRKLVADHRSPRLLLGRENVQTLFLCMFRSPR